MNGAVPFFPRGTFLPAPGLPPANLSFILFLHRDSECQDPVLLRDSSHPKLALSESEGSQQELPKRPPHSTIGAHDFSCLNVHSSPTAAAARRRTGSASV